MFVGVCVYYVYKIAGRTRVSILYEHTIFLEKIIIYETGYMKKKTTNIRVVAVVRNLTYRKNYINK